MQQNPEKKGAGTHATKSNPPMKLSNHAKKTKKKNGIRELLVGKKKEIVDDVAVLAAECEFAVKYAQKGAILGGILSSIMGFVAVLAIVWSESPDTIGPNMAVAVLSLFYGVLFVLILMPIQGRLHKMQ